MGEKSKKASPEGYSYSLPIEQVRWPYVESAIVGALNRMASALEAQVQAIELLARATAGEFDAGDEERLPRSLGER